MNDTAPSPTETPAQQDRKLYLMAHRSGYDQALSELLDMARQKRDRGERIQDLLDVIDQLLQRYKPPQP